MEKRRVNRPLLSLFLASLLWMGTAGAAQVLQRGEFYVSVSQSIANALDSNNGSVVFNLRWSIDNGGLSNQLRIATSINNSTPPYVPLSATSGISSGGVLHIEGIGRNGVLYKFGLTDKVSDSFYLGLASPGTREYFEATNTAGFIVNLAEDGTVLSSSYFPSKSAFDRVKNKYIEQQAELNRQQEILAKHQADIEAQETTWLLKDSEIKPTQPEIKKDN